MLNCLMVHLLTAIIVFSKHAMHVSIHIQDPSTGFNPMSFTGDVFCEPPDQRVYKFKGFW